jgi:hypothetical protein
MHLKCTQVWGLRAFALPTGQSLIDKIGHHVNHQVTTTLLRDSHQGCLECAETEKPFLLVGHVTIFLPEWRICR